MQKTYCGVFFFNNLKVEDTFSITVVLGHFCTGPPLESVNLSRIPRMRCHQPGNDIMTKSDMTHEVSSLWCQNPLHAYLEVSSIVFNETYYQDSELAENSVERLPHRSFNEACVQWGSSLSSGLLLLTGAAPWGCLRLSWLLQECTSAGMYNQTRGCAPSCLAILDHAWAGDPRRWHMPFHSVAPLLPVRQARGGVMPPFSPLQP